MSWLRENSEIESANGNFVSPSINLKNKSVAGDGCRNKTIEKTILRTFRARKNPAGMNRPMSEGTGLEMLFQASRAVTASTEMSRLISVSRVRPTLSVPPNTSQKYLKF